LTGRFVPQGFEPPVGRETPDFILEPLGPQHNERDHAAWSSSIEHIRATPGFPLPEDPWPVAMTLAENLADLQMHTDDFAAARGFTYSVLDPRTRDVIGCVYLYPARDPMHDVFVRSWVRASRAELDPTLREVVSTWLGQEWPWTRIDYAEARRPGS